MAPRKTAAAKVEAKPEAYTVTIRGKEYPVEEFTTAHLRMVTKVVQRNPKTRKWEMGSFSEQSEAAEVVLEAIIPTLPDSIIKARDSGRFIWLLEDEELSEFLLRIVQIYWERRDKEAQESGDTAAIAQSQKELQGISELISNGGTTAIN